MSVLPVSEQWIATASDEAATMERKWLSIELLGYLNWPLDQIAREQFYLEPLLPAHVSENLRLRYSGANGGDPTANLIDALNYKQAVNCCGRPFSLVQHHGYQAVSSSIRNLIPRWQLAGLRLYLTARMALHHEEMLKAAGGASLTKARQLLEDFTKWNGTDIDKAWKSHKAVAHLAAAVIHIANESLPRRSSLGLHIANDPKRSAEDSERIHHWWELKLALDSEPCRILRVASAFQDFATKFRPHPRVRDLLDRKELWLVSGNCGIDLLSTLPKLAEPWAARLRARSGGGEGDHKREANGTEKPKTRTCLKCKKRFLSAWIGDRHCLSCKSNTRP